MTNIVKKVEYTNPLLSRDLAEVKRYLTNVKRTDDLPTVISLINKGEVETVINVISAGFDMVAQALGVPNGINRTQCVVISDKMEVLNLHEINQFIYKCCTLQYKTKYQTTKDGLRVEVVDDWLEQFLDERELTLRNRKERQSNFVYDVVALKQAKEYTIFDNIVKKHNEVMESGKKDWSESDFAEIKRCYFNYQQWLLFGDDKAAASKIGAIKDISDVIEMRNAAKDRLLKFNSDAKKISALKQEVKQLTNFLCDYIIVGDAKISCTQDQVDKMVKDRVAVLKELKDWYSQISNIYTDDFVERYGKWTESWYGKAINPETPLKPAELTSEITRRLSDHYDRCGNRDAFLQSLAIKADKLDDKFNTLINTMSFLTRKAKIEYASRAEVVLTRPMPMLEYQYVFFYINCLIKGK
jgi:hypothetical protein